MLRASEDVMLMVTEESRILDQDQQDLKERKWLRQLTIVHEGISTISPVLDTRPVRLEREKGYA